MSKDLKFIDLFCGIGGFRVAFEDACKELQVGVECVFSLFRIKKTQGALEELRVGHSILLTYNLFSLSLLGIRCRFIFDSN
ncbi:MAG: DNA cytosine methyltransferase [Flavobacteriaceae bacterium]